MKHRNSFFETAMLAIVALLACSEVHAQPHMTSQWDETALQPTDMNVWLRRLVGRYRFEGMVEVAYEGESYPDHRCAPLPPDPGVETPPPPANPYCGAIKGMGDCIGIGPGPGVQCVLNVTWQDLYEVTPEGAFNLPGGVSNLAPAMLLYGIDQGKAAIHYLLGDNKGLPEGGLGHIAGDRATFKTPCVNAQSLFLAMKPAPRERREGQPRTCERTIRIDAKPDAKVLFLSMDIEINDEVWTRYEMTLRRVPQAVTGTR